MRKLLTALIGLLLVGVPAVDARAGLVWHLDQIRYHEAVNDERWAHHLSLGAGQSIVILDTGIDPDHVLLNDRAVSGGDFTPGAGSWADVHGHGTAVASVAAGRAAWLTTGEAITGVAPHAGLMSLRVLDHRGTGSFASINNALAWLIDAVRDGQASVDAVNLSLGSETTFASPGELFGSTVETFNDHARALRDMGIPVIAAAGNDGDSEALSFPAISPYVISVGASTRSDTFASFSNRNTELDLVAPGRGIIAAWAGLGAGPDNMLGSYDGTSFAAPQVAAAVLLINELHEALHGRRPGQEEMLELLRTSETVVEDVAAGVAVPRLDVFAALEAMYVAAVPVPEPGTAAVMAALVLAATRVRWRRRDQAVTGNRAAVAHGQGDQHAGGDRAARPAG